MRELSPSKYKKVSRGKTLTKSARSWITQESIVCSIFIMDKRTDVSGIITVPVLCHLSMLPRIDCEAIRRVEERAWQGLRCSLM